LNGIKRDFGVAYWIAHDGHTLRTAFRIKEKLAWSVVHVEVGIVRLKRGLDQAVQCNQFIPYICH
jgi:hypothetical protein